MREAGKPVRGREVGKGNFGADCYQSDARGNMWERVPPAGTIQPILAGASMLYPTLPSAHAGSRAGLAW